MKIRIFTKLLKPKVSLFSKPLGPEDCGLEDEINAWLLTVPDIDIKDIKQTQSGGSLLPPMLTVTIWYQ
jgi:hypothetical protein